MPTIRTTTRTKVLCTRVYNLTASGVLKLL
jgi:hypothetical protein